MQRSEFEAGPNQAIVVYTPGDYGRQIDPVAIYRDVAVDAQAWAANGWRIVSTSAMPVRHVLSLQGREGWGSESQVAIMIVYANR